MSKADTPNRQRHPLAIIFAVLLVVLVVADFVIQPDNHITGYYITLASGGSAGLLVLAKIVAGLLRRGEDYYDD